MCALPAMQAASPAQTVALRIVFPVHLLNIYNLPPKYVCLPAIQTNTLIIRAPIQSA